MQIERLATAAPSAVPPARGRRGIRISRRDDGATAAVASPIDAVPPESGLLRIPGVPVYDPSTMLDPRGQAPPGNSLAQNIFGHEWMVERVKEMLAVFDDPVYRFAAGVQALIKAPTRITEKYGAAAVNEVFRNAAVANADLYRRPIASNVNDVGRDILAQAARQGKRPALDALTLRDEVYRAPSMMFPAPPPPPPPPRGEPRMTGPINTPLDGDDDSSEAIDMMNPQHHGGDPSSLPLAGGGGGGGGAGAGGAGGAGAAAAAAAAASLRQDMQTFHTNPDLIGRLSPRSMRRAYASLPARERPAELNTAIAALNPETPALVVTDRAGHSFDGRRVATTLPPRSTPAPPPPLLFPPPPHFPDGRPNVSVPDGAGGQHYVYNLDDGVAMGMRRLAAGGTTPSDLAMWRTLYDEGRGVDRPPRRESRADTARRFGSVHDAVVSHAATLSMSGDDADISWRTLPEHLGFVFLTDEMRTALVDAAWMVHYRSVPRYYAQRSSPRERQRVPTIDLMTHEMTATPFRYLVAYIIMRTRALHNQSRNDAAKMLELFDRQIDGVLNTLSQVRYNAPGGFLRLGDAYDSSAYAQRRALNAQRMHYAGTHRHAFTDVVVDPTTAAIAANARQAVASSFGDGDAARAAHAERTMPLSLDELDEAARRAELVRRVIGPL